MTTTTLSTAAAKFVAEAVLPGFSGADTKALYMAFIEAKAIEVTDAKWDNTLKGAEQAKMAKAHRTAKLRRIIAWNAYAEKVNMPKATFDAKMKAEAKVLGLIS